MHRLPSKKSIIRMRATAILICLKFLTATAAGICISWGIIADDDKSSIAGLALLIATFILAIAQWILAAKTYCPLCHTPVMSSKRCSRSRKARKFLGSYKLQVALAVIFTGRFRCPYCGEPSTLDVRNRR
jgi:predicted RNA-binding Zn-ribbon protein involved in translation (DUF1610 family)